MARWSPLTIGLIGLVVVVSGVGIYLVSRPRHTTDAAVVPAEPEPSNPHPTSELPSAPANPEAETQRRLAALPPSAPAAPPAPREPPISSDGATGTDGPPGRPDRQEGREDAWRRRGLIIALNNQKRREEADEHVFETRRLSDDTRAAIRRINEAFADRVRASWNTQSDAPAGGTPISPTSARNADADRARHLAIENLLGLEGGREFGSAERVAIQQIRGKYRLEQARLLRQ